ncbi:MAG: hypothetical protein QXQ14_00045 [Candidatus Aenigmatarchaeota archaeon]
MIEKIANYIPVIEKPKTSLTLRDKFKWFLIIVALYSLLSNIETIGVSPLVSQDPITYYFSLLLGARIGSIFSLGIAPLITAGIILHVLTSSKILNLDLQNPEDRKKYENYEKVLALFFGIVEAFIIIYSGYLPILPGFTFIVFLQLLLGVFLILIFHSLAKKYTFGAGIINIAIFSGVATQLIIFLFSPYALTTSGFVLWFKENEIPSGHVLQLIISLLNKDLNLFVLAIVPIISTLAIVLLTLYLLNSKIYVGSLEFKMMRSIKQPFELNLLYVSVLPIIFASSFLVILSFAASSTLTIQTGNLRCGIFGCVDLNGNPVSGLIYYITPPNPIYATQEPLKEVTRAIIYFLLLTALTTIFGFMWVYSAGMDPKTVAENLVNSGMTISGLRDNPSILENFLKNYIPYLTFLSCFLISLIAILADLLGALGGRSGVSLFLLVSVIYSFHMILKREKSENIPKALEYFIK